MLDFKGCVEKDTATFFNLNEFAETHTINGEPISMVIDNERLKECSKKEYDGLSIGELMILVPVENIKIKIKQEMPIIFDGKQMYVFSVREEMGMYEIVLNQNIGG